MAKKKVMHQYSIPATLIRSAVITVEATSPEEAMERFLAMDWADEQETGTSDFHATGPATEDD